MNGSQIVIATVAAVFSLAVFVTAVLDARARRKRERKREEEKREKLARANVVTSSGTSFTGSSYSISVPAASYNPPLTMSPPAMDYTTYTSHDPVLMWRGYSDPAMGSYRGDWTSGYLEARCEGNQGFWTTYETPHATSPHPYCSCGIYGYSKGMPAHPYTALTAGYGIVIEHDRGYRVEHAQIIAYFSNGRMPDGVWPGITRCKTPEKLMRVRDYYSKHGDELWIEIERLRLERMYHYPAARGRKDGL